MKAIKGKQLQDLGRQPSGLNFRLGNIRAHMHWQTHKLTQTHIIYRQSPTHFLCVSCKTGFSSFSCVRRGSAGLMTFPMRHEHHTRGRQTAALHVCACENLYAYMHEPVKGSTHAGFVMHLLDASFVFLRVCAFERLHIVCVFLWEKVMHVFFVSSQKMCTLSYRWVYF